MVAHGFGVASSSEQKRKRSENDRFAGPGFAGQYVQSGMQGDIDRVNQRIIGYM